MSLNDYTKKKKANWNLVNGVHILFLWFCACILLLLFVASDEKIAKQFSANP